MTVARGLKADTTARESLEARPRSDRDRNTAGVRSSVLSGALAFNDLAHFRERRFRRGSKTEAVGRFEKPRRFSRFLIPSSPWIGDNSMRGQSGLFDIDD